MARCDACNRMILLGGVKYVDWTLCNQACVRSLKAALVDHLMPAAEVAATIAQLSAGPCPRCKRPDHVDVFSSSTVTGMLVAYRVAHSTTMCCARCAKTIRLQAALQCLIGGWWSVHAAIHNLFHLPRNLIGALVARSPASPSATMIQAVKVRLAEINIGALRTAVRAAAQTAAAGGKSPLVAQAAATEREQSARIDDGPNPYRPR